MSTPQNQDDILLVDSLAINYQLQQHIYDMQGVLLLAKGTQITQRLKSQLKQRGIKHYSKISGIARPEKIEKQETKNQNKKSIQPHHTNNNITNIPDHIQDIHAHIQQAQYTPLPCQPPRLPIKELKEQVHQGIKVCGQIGTFYSQITHHVIQNQMPEIQQSHYFDLLQSIQKFNAKDKSILPLLVKMQAHEKTHIKHAINTAIIAILLAQELNFDTQAVQDIGCSAILQDLGMLKIPQYVKQSNQNLSKNERWQIQQHPKYTLELLKNSPHISQQALITIYQSHERCNGSGYPNAYQKEKIHPLARVLAVADTYVAMISDRPHRKAIKPHQAVQQLLELAANGQHDPTVVKALLDTLSAYPIGSIVRLNDGTNARVIWANRHYHTKPVVTMLNQEGHIDLTIDHERHIVKALNDDWEKQVPLSPAA